MDDVHVAQTLGVAILAFAREPIEQCLSKLSGPIDELIVFTPDDLQAENACRLGATVMRMPPASHAELLRQKMQQSMSTDWVLLLDPDEELESNAIPRFREYINQADNTTTGLWVPYYMHFCGRPLANSFPRLSQMRLFRRNRVTYSGIIHESPTPVVGLFQHMPEDAPGIIHQFVISLRDRIERHVQWAFVEAQTEFMSQNSPTSLREILHSCSNELGDYLLDRQGTRDGSVGVVNAFLHAWKDLIRMLLLWEMNGCPEFSEQHVEQLQSEVSRIRRISADLPK